MAYGKIKVDTLTYDDSGSNVDVTISSLAAKAPLASPTFTGTVTIPTPTSGDDSTKAASTAFVVAGFAPKANPTFTGNAAGVNLTLSGTLTVNGTTTTVASTNTTVTDNLLELNSGATSNANDSGIIIERGSTGDNAIFAWDESADKFIVGTTTGTADSTGDITIAAAALVTSTVEDSKGDLRTIVQTIKSAQHTIVAADSGKHSINSTGGWIINTSTGFTAGQAITLINNSGSNQTITNTGCTMYLAGDTSAKSSLTLKGRGMATFICTASNVYYGSGGGLE